jgi:hypothetical protein
VRRKSAFVPRAVLGATFASVVPVLGACGNGQTPPGVAAVAYCCFEAGVAEMGFDAEAGKEAGKEAGSDASDASDAGDARDGG